jgi:hypothetical protein
MIGSKWIKEVRMKRWQIGYWSVGEPEICTWINDYVEAETKDEAFELAVQQGYRRKALNLKESPKIKTILGVGIVTT